jgi:GT2 family glycosyltransferase
VSVVIVSWNGRELLERCLEALDAQRGVAFQTVVVDNGSIDGTIEMLESRYPSVETIANRSNRGFAAANNQGLTVARGEALVLLNNDTIVSRGWLARLIDHVAGAQIGVVCACTNRIGNEAEIDVSYRTFGELGEFAGRRLREHAGAMFDIPMAPMFCFALRRDVFDKVGKLDEQFETGMFEDDDYSMRIRAAGMRVCCADDVFVHHFGGTSFGSLVASGEHGRIFRANRERFEKKWGTTWKSHGGRRKPDYDALVDAIRATVAANLPKNSTIAIISKGDVELLKLESHRAWHFPRMDDGQYSGHYPADSGAAVAHLEWLRESGCEYLLIPRTAMWWMDHYPQFAEHLDREYRRVTIDTDACAIFDLTKRGRATDANEEHWQDRHLRELAEAILPQGAPADAYVLVPARRAEWFATQQGDDLDLIVQRDNVGAIYQRNAR